MWLCSCCPIIDPINGYSPCLPCVPLYIPFQAGGVNYHNDSIMEENGAYSFLAGGGRRKPRYYSDYMYLLPRLRQCLMCLQAQVRQW